VEDGRIVQAGTPQELYNAPASLFAAEFMGSNNVLRGTIVEERLDRVRVAVGGAELWGLKRTGKAVGEEVAAVIRLERVSVGQGENHVRAELQTSVFLGERWEHLFLLAGSPLRVFHPGPLAPGPHWLRLPSDQLWVF
jgi:iron(III) transport system ATP-binding protein